MDRLPNIIELDDSDPELPDQPSTSHDREDLTTSQNASQALSLPGTSQALDQNLARGLDYLIEKSRKRGAVIANTVVFNQNQGDKIKTDCYFSKSSDISVQKGDKKKKRDDSSSEEDAPSTCSNGNNPIPGSIRLTDTLYMLHYESISKLGNVNKGVKIYGKSGQCDIAVKSLKYSEDNEREARILVKISPHQNVANIIDSGFKQPQSVEELKRQKDEAEKEKQELKRSRQQLEKMMHQQSQEMEQTKKENKELRQKIIESQSSSQASSSGLRIINQQPPDGRMSVEELDEPLPGYGLMGTLVITYSFPAGSLNGVSYEAKEFTEYFPEWPVCEKLLRKAFNAGLLFKIQIIGSSRGEIIWNDEIPHKTNKHGGPDNNGYPDDDHEINLWHAMIAKLKAAGIELLTVDDQQWTFNTIRTILY
uniref:uncharacterized protein LOC120333272 isoform X2 n=1 Tax=Styela clava TaxID=7725 RepID=UPI001939EF37|nr:uncharacterized protein LOC120333272 isoform X2 [Styela clava]